MKNKQEFNQKSQDANNDMPKLVLDYCDADEATKQKADELYDQLKGFSPKAFETRASEMISQIRKQAYDTYIFFKGSSLSPEGQRSVLEKKPLSPTEKYEGISQRLTINKKKVEAYTKILEQSTVTTCMLSKAAAEFNKSFVASAIFTVALYHEVKNSKWHVNLYETHLKEIEKDLKAPKDKPSPKTPSM